MSFDDANAKTEIAPDLTEPSLEGLSWALRHPEHWARHHVWNFRYCLKEHKCGTSGCAMGIAAIMWPQCHGLFVSLPYVLQREFKMSPEDFDRIFNDGAIEETYGVKNDDDVTPTMVADAIDKYLAERRK